MSDATDVLHAIDQLRRDLSGYHGQFKAHNDLQRHCDSQRKRIGELEGLYAKAKEEIAGLRELVRRLLIEYRYMRSRPRRVYLEHEKRMRAIEDTMRELGIEVKDEF